MNPSQFLKFLESNDPKFYRSLRDQMIGWTPPEKTPSDLSQWYEVFDEVMGFPSFGGRVKLKWEEDGWRLTLAVSPFRESPSGTIGKPVDVREELVNALLAKGLPVKA